MESKYFKISEFECKGRDGCHLPENCPPSELLEVLTEIREHYNAPLIITSGYRCEHHNKEVGGAAHSQHLKGDAVDFIVKGVRTKDVYNYITLQYGDRPYGLAFKHNENNPYGGFIHLDTRGKKTRWEYK